MRQSKHTHTHAHRQTYHSRVHCMPVTPVRDMCLCNFPSQCARVTTSQSPRTCVCVATIIPPSPLPSHMSAPDSTCDCCPLSSRTVNPSPSHPLPFVMINIIMLYMCVRLAGDRYAHILIRKVANKYSLLYQQIYTLTTFKQEN